MKHTSFWMAALALQVWVGLSNNRYLGSSAVAIKNKALCLASPGSVNFRKRLFSSNGNVFDAYITSNSCIIDILIQIPYSCV